MTRTTRSKHQHMSISCHSRQKADDKFPTNTKSVVKLSSSEEDKTIHKRLGETNDKNLAWKLKKQIVDQVPPCSTTRRHSWGVGMKSSFELEHKFDISDDDVFLDTVSRSVRHECILPSSEGNHQSSSDILSRRRSSNSSLLEESIEECPSDEEDEESTTSTDYMKCKNCSKDSGINEQNPIETINFCYNCRHRFKSTSVFGTVVGAFDRGRRSSWTAGDKRETFAQRLGCSKYSSTRGSLELPSISEPETDE